MPDQRQADDVSTDSMAPTAIIGLGAFAGGIEAFRSFFSNVESGNGLCFIVVLHLMLNRKSVLAEILGSWTSLTVQMAVDGMSAMPDHVYVIPPNAALTLVGGHLRVVAIAAGNPRDGVIDTLFASLAAELGTAAIGAVLSGMGHDGSLGLKAIKSLGGITLAQGTDHTAPEHPGMVDSAIASGAVDLVLPVQEMPARILQFVRTGRSRVAEDQSLGLGSTELRADICQILLEQVGHDFSGYKEQTFFRRLQRRMQVVALGPASYVERLRHDPDEVRLLFRDLLIGVTGFFRDAAAFEMVRTTVIPRLFEGRGAEDTIRIWVAGCSTGEEAYSLAILFREHADTLEDPPKITVFATDIDEAAIAVARAGRYPAILLGDVPLGRFFDRADNGWTVVKAVRDMCTFSAHSVIRDPPFSRLNLVSCRNLLIYLDKQVQEQVIPAFHYALVPRGLLLLGGSETVARQAELFTAIDRRHRIFERVDAPSPSPRVPSGLSGQAVSSLALFRVGEMAADLSRPMQQAQARIQERYSPAWALASGTGDVLHYSPRTGKYLEIATGAPSNDLIAQARPGLRLPLRAALGRARASGRVEVRSGVGVHFKGGFQAVTLTVEPLPRRRAPSGLDERGSALFLVVFSDDGAIQPVVEAPANGAFPQDATIEQLEGEVRQARDEAQAIGEGYETALEELRSASEEPHSLNEELQSSNEELETSKEEIQSVNEELHTVNQQLSSKIDELDRANNDLRNVFESTQVATVFLDRNLVIRGFTPAIVSIYNLSPADLGRPISDIASTIDYGDLAEDARLVVTNRQSIERRVSRSDQSNHYLLRILPYRGLQDEVDGALATFLDVTSMVMAEQHQRLLVDELNHRVRNMLAVVISLAAQTQRSARSLEEFGDAFLGRLHALSSTYTLVSRDNWTEIPLRELLASELAPYGRRDSVAVVLVGPGVLLKPKAALALGMLVHELATNAVKYGAFSVPEGRIGVTWLIEPNADSDAGTLVWSWRERGGPPVQPPSRRGFGTTLIERSVRHELGGNADIRFAESGLEVTFTIPMDPTALFAPA